MINPSASPIRIMQPGSSLLGRSEVTRTPGILLPKQARYQLRYTPIVIKLWSSKWSNMWSNTFLTVFFHFPNRPKYARLKGFRRFSLSCGVKTAYAPKPSALLDELHFDSISFFDYSVLYTINCFAVIKTCFRGKFPE